MSNSFVGDNATWDMSPFFPSPDSLEVRDYCGIVNDRIISLHHSFEALDAICRETITAWERALLEFEKVDEQCRHLGVYLRCLRSADTGDGKIQQLDSKVLRLWTDIESLNTKLKLAFSSAHDDDFEFLLQLPSLVSARFYLKRLREEASHSMSPELESLAADLQLDGLFAWGKLYDNISSGLTFQMKWSDGREGALSMTERWGLVTGANRSDRKAAYDGAMQAWKSVEVPVAACLNGIAGSRLTTWSQSGYSHFLDKALLDRAVERDSVDCMIEVIGRNRDLAWEILQTKARLLGHDKLGPHDIVAPIQKENKETLSLDVARQTIIRSFDKYCPPLARSAEEIFDCKWIEAEKRPGKIPGAFCLPAHLIGQSRVFMTWAGTLADENTLAHELGHGFHWSETKELRLWQQKQPITLAETASIVAEGLFRKAVLEDPKTSDEDRLSMLVTDLDAASTYLLHMPCMYEFEVSFYEERSKGDVPIFRMNELMLDSHSKWFGGSLVENSLSSYYWASVPHFYMPHQPFYNFPYSLGYLLGQGLIEKFGDCGPDFAPEYCSLLRSTGSTTVEDFAKKAMGADLSKPHFWQKMIDTVEVQLSKVKEFV